MLLAFMHACVHAIVCCRVGTVQSSATWLGAHLPSCQHTTSGPTCRFERFERYSQCNVCDFRCKGLVRILCVIRLKPHSILSGYDLS